MESCSPDGPTSYLSAIESQELFHFQKFEEEFKKPEDNVSEEITRLSDIQKQYAARYLSIGINAGVVERFPTMEEVLDEDIVEREKELREYSEQIKAAEKKVAELQATLRAFIPRILEKYDEFSTKHAQFLDEYRLAQPKWQTFLDACAQAQEGNKENRHYGQSSAEDIRMHTLAQCQAVLQNQEKIIQNLKQSLICTAVFTSSHDILRVKADIEQLEAAVSETDKDHNKKAEWYRAGTACLMRMNHCDVSINRGEMLIGFREHLPSFREPPRLRIQFSQEGNRLQGCVLEPPVLALADVVNHAVQFQDLAFLVGEVRARLKKYGSRMAKLQQIMTNFGLRLEFDENHLLIVRIHVGAKSLVFKIDVHPFFPAPGPIVIHVDPAASLHYEVVQNLNQDFSLSLEDRITALLHSSR